MEGIIILPPVPILVRNLNPASKKISIPFSQANQWRKMFLEKQNLHLLGEKTERKGL